MSTTLSRVELPEVGIRALKAAPVIIATDGREQSDPALTTGRILAGDGDGALRVVTVVRPLPLVSPEASIPHSVEGDVVRRAEQKHAVLEQMRRVWGDESQLDVEVYDGDAATGIADLAHESNASLIVAGLGRHRVMDRLFGDETALRLIRLSGVPILAVAPGLTHAPQRIVVAVDFTETSLRAARMSIELASREATIYLTHVIPRDATTYNWDNSTSTYREDAGYALRKVLDQLHVPDDMSVQRVLLHGDPATELLAFAASVHADLIATGSHGYGFVARMLVGSVTTRILRCATCSVLTVPHLAAMTRARTSAEPPVRAVLERPTWATELHAFSRRNMGRRGVLEMDDPEIGAQAQENDYPFLGATFDQHDKRVELMFGELGDVRRHLTRSIGGPSGIDVMKDDRGRDLALRVVHGAGQTLLTFAD
jgi:nucleotide-binding universal stress UspA family protein